MTEKHVKKACKRIAVFPAKGLGDGLLSLILANQLSQLGHTVTLYHSFLGSLKSWLPPVVIQAFPLEADLTKEFAEFDHVIAMDHTPVSRFLQPSERLTILYQREFDRKRSIAKNLLSYLHQHWNSEATLCAGICIPKGLEYRRYRKRVVIHPTSGADCKNWPAEKFIQLAHHLRDRGCDPVLSVCPQEAPEWLWAEEEQDIPLQISQSLKDLAAFLYESGSFIGNDSGTGHLASLLKIPTVSLFARESHAKLWRPDWGPGVIVTPWLPLPGSRLKQKFWKDLLSVNQVLQAHQKLSRN